MSEVERVRVGARLARKLRDDRGWDFEGKGWTPVAGGGYERKAIMSEFKPAETRPAEDPEPDWFDLSLSRATWRPLGLLAAFWQMSRENVIATLIRAVQYREWPEGDIMTDPAAFQEWCLRVTGAATHLRLPTRKDESMGFDSNGWWEGVDRERRERERAERIMNEKLDAAASAVCFCTRCHALREGLSLMRDDGLCEECHDRGT